MIRSRCTSIKAPGAIPPSTANTCDCHPARCRVGRVFEAHHVPLVGLEDSAHPTARSGVALVMPIGSNVAYVSVRKTGELPEMGRLRGTREWAHGEGMPSAGRS